MQTPRPALMPTPPVPSVSEPRISIVGRRPPGLAFAVQKGLASDIRSGALSPGDKLPSEAELMQRYGVSRTVVREAISHLQASGLAQTKHGIGSFVMHPRESANFKIASADFETVADVISVLELRISLESETAGLAALRRTADDLSAMSQILATFVQAIEQQSDAVPSDFEFHMQVARATGNRHFVDLMNYLGTMIIPRTRINTAKAAPEGPTSYLKQVHREHETIFQAIADEDAEGARTAMRTHLTNSRERLRQAQWVK